MMDLRIDSQITSLQNVSVGDRFHCQIAAGLSIVFCLPRLAHLSPKLVGSVH